MNNKLYFTYRMVYTDRWTRQDVSFYNDQIFSDYKEAWLTKMVDGDNFIPSNLITKEVAPGIKSLRKAGYLEYNPAIPREQIEADLLRTTGNFLTEIKTTEEMRQWIRDNTSLTEWEVWVFSYESIDPIEMETKIIELIID